jgi:hypothetical protein
MGRKGIFGRELEGENTAKVQEQQQEWCFGTWSDQSEP